MHKYNHWLAKFIKWITFGTVECFTFRGTKYHSHGRLQYAYWGDFEWGDGTKYTGDCDGTEEKE